jgi:hypothetical protein
MKGTRKRIPQSPYTTLGMAARSSTRKIEGSRNLLGANSDWKRAMPKLIGTAKSREISVVTTDP